MDAVPLIGLLAFSIVLHEVSHGLTAFLLGDDTAKRAGRLSLNPLKHIDPVWTVIFPALLYFSTGGQFVFAMAKPVPVNFARLHEPKKDMGFVGLAGPLMNLLLAGGFAMAWRAFGHELLLMAVYMNIGLAVFNMIPIPPLDGSRVLASLLPGNWAHAYLRWERFGYLFLLVLYFTHVLMKIIIPAADVLCRIVNVPRLSEVGF